VRVGDARESELPAVGLVEFEDPETRERIIVNTSAPAFRSGLRDVSERWRERTDRALRRSKVDVIDVVTGEPYVKALMRFFRERAKRR
jgi:uncharacterized protein (DUF58 family)